MKPEREAHQKIKILPERHDPLLNIYESLGAGEDHLNLFRGFASRTEVNFE